jgi:hypothetical protein
MRAKKYIKFLTWREDDRGNVTLGANTRINPATNCAQLGTYDSAEYPTDLDLYVKSRLTSPAQLHQWLGFEVDVRNKFVDTEQVTGVQFRLSDGTSEYWWNGAAWEVNTSDWNSEAEVANNISSFGTSTKRLQVVVNLWTTDPSQTPELAGIKVLYSATVNSEIEDLIERSLVPLLKSSLRPLARVTLVKSDAEDDDEIEIPQYRIDTDYRFVGVDAVFNHTDDPDHENDLYDSHTTRSTPSDLWHNGTVNVITLSESVDAGKLLWLQLLYEPVVTLGANQDYYELAHVPALVIERLEYHGRALRGENYVGNRSDGTAVVIGTVLQGRLEMTVAVTTDKIFDSFGMSDELEAFFGGNPLIASVGLDDSYRLRVVGTLDFSTPLVNNELRTWRITAYIEDVLVYVRDERSDYLVNRLMIEGTLDVEVTEP